MLKNYSFTPESTPYDNVKLRVVSGTSPEAPIESVNEFLPSQKLLEKEDDLHLTTEILSLYANKYSPGKFGNNKKFGFC